MILNALSHQNANIEAGATFLRYGTGALVESARVLEVGRDKMGIPHVRFQLQVKRGTGIPTVEERTLALEVFQTRYREQDTENRKQTRDR
jgi:hypothetical protein